MNDLIELKPDQQRRLIKSILEGRIARQDNPELWHDDFVADTPELTKTEEKTLKQIVRKIYGKPIPLDEPEQISISKKIKSKLIKSILRGLVQKTDFPEIWPQPLPGWMDNLTPDETQFMLNLSRQTRYFPILQNK